ncbi:S-adenosyl-L-methionine-dependent methyltransferase [Lentinula aciculospora]|uniref:Trimethylguanosine synthase n=1 Tax=Lentinula aciculospora TaxID=153920 RepID=A0A9W9AH29_9AGAR|nr:S-adenosyl-L-methionine-dependent methyltransferase [Lentinula aciculospora]
MGKRSTGFSGLARFVSPSTTANVQNPTKRPFDPSNSSESQSPMKKKKAEDTKADTPTSLIKSVQKYDMSGSVPVFTSMQEVPDNLKKYYAQRERFFSLYSTPPGCLLDEEGWYSVTPERIAHQIAERCRCDTILDAFCGVGGNAIAFAKTCQRVIALDISPIRLALARHNAQIYGVAEHIEFILADYISFAKTYISSPQTATSRKIDVVFLSPPWGGPSYLSGSGSPSNSETSVPADPVTFSLSDIRPIHGVNLFELSRSISSNIAYYLPRNMDLNEISALTKEDLSKGNSPEFIEVEEEWMGRKLKALTCYFGGLAEGQSELFDIK